MKRAAGTAVDSFGGPFLTYYRCPSDRTFELGNQNHAAISLIPGSSTSSWWSSPATVPEMTSYMFNEAVLGVSPSSESGRNDCLRGRIDEVPYPADIFLLTDGEPRQEWDDHLMTVWHDGTLPDWSFWQYRTSMMTVSPFNCSQLDYKRHSKSMNVAYIDGHTAASVVGRSTPADSRSAKLARVAAYNDPNSAVAAGPPSISSRRR